MANCAQILYQLQSLDSELSERLSKQRESEALLGKSPALRDARRRLQEANADLADCGTHLRELEMDLKKVNERLAVTRGRLYGGRITNPKELANLQQDFQHSEGSRETLEDDILGALVLLEDCEQAVSEAGRRLAEVDQAWKEQQASLAERIERLRAEIADLEEERTEIASLVESGDLALYEDLRCKKGGRAVALLAGAMCQGCRVTVPATKAQLVRKSTGLVTCSSCGRILNPQS